MDITVEKMNDDEMKKRGISSWPVWTKEVSEFDWHYDSMEECYLLEGNVSVVTDDGKEVEFGKGDFVTFPKGLSCRWRITKPVRKHYNFK
ncbi:MAG: cupin domain-containing protein [Spirochaetales bacterium]|nr:cupin domain-containing protein [Spirochaetales bacterium]